jgi:predicted ABC-type ATPase
MLLRGIFNVDLAADRVRYRVIPGGHDVPEAVIRRRFEQGWKIRIVNSSGSLTS